MPSPCRAAPACPPLLPMLPAEGTCATARDLWWGAEEEEEAAPEHPPEQTSCHIGRAEPGETLATANWHLPPFRPAVLRV